MIKIHAFNITFFKIEAGLMFGSLPQDVWVKDYPVDENGHCTLALRSMVMEDQGRVFLIDNGFGDKQSEEFLAPYSLHGGEGLLAGLKGCGFAPEDITDVILTHLHFDHCGGSLRFNKKDKALENVFPNATYWISQLQWDGAMHPDIREKDSFLSENIMPMQDLCNIHFLNEPAFIHPKIELRFFHGHTSGQIVPIIYSNCETVVFMADLIPCTVNLNISSVSAYDMKPETSILEKTSFLNEAAEKGYTLIFQHDAYMESCKVQKVTDRFEII